MGIRRISKCYKIGKDLGKRKVGYRIASQPRLKKARTPGPLSHCGVVFHSGMDAR